jgi:hypothetical protein
MNLQRAEHNVPERASAVLPAGRRADAEASSKTRAGMPAGTYSTMESD